VRSDPWPPSTREQRVKRVITRANAILWPPIVTVTVKSGDTLSGMASSHGLTQSATGLPRERQVPRQSRLIHPGDIVRVK
jgi:LysM domain-containing protein